MRANPGQQNLGCPQAYKFPRFWIRGVILGTIVLILGGWTASCRTDKSSVYLIGALYPLTGKAARYGEDSRAAAEMAAEKINSNGGIHGRKLRLIFRDEEANAERARELAREFILRDRVDFLMGVVSSSAGLAVSDLSLSYKKIFIGTDHGSSRLTYENFQKYYFRVNNNTYQATAAGALYAKEQPWRRYYTIGPDYEYGHIIWEDFKWLMKKHGVKMQVDGEAWPKLFEPDYTSYITAIKTAKPDVLFCSLWGGDMVTFLKQAAGMGLFDEVTLFSPDTGGNYEVFEALGDAIPEGLVLGAKHHNNWPETQANKEYVTEFKKRTGRFPTYAAEGAYVGVKFIAQALEIQPDTKDVDALVKVMETMKIPCPEDPEGFTSYMDPLTHQIVQMHAIGITRRNTSFPPATRMLANWKVFDAELLVPTPEEVRERRKARGMK